MNWTRSTAKQIFLITLCLLAVAPSARADGGPLFVRNSNPVYLAVSAPPVNRFDFYDGSTWHATILSQYASMFADSEVDGVELENPISLDMETFSIVGRLERRINAFSSFSVEVPVVAHWKGVFDGLIENYHDLVGLGNGGRERVPHDRFAYRLGELDLDGPEMGIGDLQLAYSIYKVRDISRFRFSFTVFCKVPTGSVADGLSSGSLDFGAAVSMANVFDQFRLDYGFGMTSYGGPDERFTDTLDDTGFGYVAVSGRIWREFEGVVQLYLSSSPFDTGYDRLDDYQAMLTIGVRWRDWEFSFSEDVFTYTAPDIMVSVSRTYRF